VSQGSPLAGAFEAAVCLTNTWGTVSDKGAVLNEMKRHLGDVWVDLGRVAEPEGRAFVDALLATEPNRLGEGFREALRKHGASLDEDLIIEADFTEAGGYYAMQQLLTARPNAVFCASDMMAVGAMRAVSEAGLKIPGDIALIGFDDLPLAKRTDPQLTTVRQPIDQLGIEAVSILLDLINSGTEPPRRVILDTELIIRGSCGSYRTT